MRPSRRTWGSLGIWIVLGCSAEDSTRVVQEELAAEPASTAAEGDEEPARSNASETSEGATGAERDGSSEAPPADLGRADAPEASAGETPPPAPPVQYWSDGVTVNGASADVDDRFHGVTMDGDDHVYAVGYLGSGLGAPRVTLVAKYDSAGQPASNFGTNGRVEIDLSPYLGTPVSDTVTTADASLEEARDVRLQSDGKLVVVARAEDPAEAAPDETTPVDIVVFRLNVDGTLDSSFGTEGFLFLNPGGGANDLAWGLDIDGQDRVYVFGHGTATNPEGAEAPRTDQDRYVWRATPEGALDASFGTAGVFTFDVPQGTAGLALNDNQRSGRVLPDGSIVSGGYTNVAGRNQVVLAKLLENGTVDTSFSSDGVVRLAPFALGMAECYGVAVQSDGSFVTTGYGNVNVERTGGAELLDMVSFRVRPDGSADPGWGVGGALVYDPAGAQDRGRAVLALADDRILFAGAVTEIGSNKDASLLLVEKDGAPARNFDEAVHKAYDFGGDNEEFFAVAVSPSGRFAAAAGYSTGTGTANGNGVLAILPLGE